MSSIPAWIEERRNILNYTERKYIEYFSNLLNLEIHDQFISTLRDMWGINIIKYNNGIAVYFGDFFDLCISVVFILEEPSDICKIPEARLKYRRKLISLKFDEFIEMFEDDETLLQLSTVYECNVLRNILQTINIKKVLSDLEYIIRFHEV